MNQIDGDNDITNSKNWKVLIEGSNIDRYSDKKIKEKRRRGLTIIQMRYLPYKTGNQMYNEISLK